MTLSDSAEWWAARNLDLGGRPHEERGGNNGSLHKFNMMLQKEDRDAIRASGFPMKPEDWERRIPCACGRKAFITAGKAIYPHRPDLFSKMFYRCWHCDSYVGCHPGTVTAMGSPADADTRRARMRAHSAFDLLWKTGLFKTRFQAYEALAESMGKPVGSTHIGQMSIAEAEQVVAFSEATRKKARDGRL